MLVRADEAVRIEWYRTHVPSFGIVLKGNVQASAVRFLGGSIIEPPGREQVSTLDRHGFNAKGSRVE